MKVFYTFGTDKQQPYYGGWVEIKAKSIELAHMIFRFYYPDKIPGVLNCADYYTEAAFNKTSMPTKGNFRTFCHRKITVILKEGPNDEPTDN